MCFFDLEKEAISLDREVVSFKFKYDFQLNIIYFMMFYWYQILNKKNEKTNSIIFSAALGISFLFIGFALLWQSHAIKVGDIKITTSEFSRQYENYKIEKQLSGLSEEEELYSKIQFVNQYVNQLVFEEYLNKKIQISDNSKKVVLKNSLNNEEMFNNLDEAVYKTT